MARAESVALNGDGGPSIQWDNKPRTLQEILMENQLPLVVKLSTENMLSSSTKSSSDVHKPLVLYKEIKGRKIYCKNVTSVDVLTGAVCREDGPIVVIPETYQGTVCSVMISIQGLKRCI